MTRYISYVPDSIKMEISTTPPDLSKLHPENLSLLASFHAIRYEWHGLDKFAAMLSEKQRDEFCLNLIRLLTMAQFPNACEVSSFPGMLAIAMGA